MLDTDVVIAALDRGDAHHREAAEAIQGIIRSGAELVLSTVNYAEALVRPAESERALAAATDAIAALGIKLIAPNAAIARDAARYRALNISLADGFALATARGGAATVATFDRRVRRAMSEIGLEPPPAMRGT